MSTQTMSGEEIGKAIDHYFATKTDEEIQADIDAARADFESLSPGQQKILTAIAKSMLP